MDEEAAWRNTVEVMLGVQKAVKKYLRDFTVPIVGRKADEVGMAGSGTLLAIGGDHFVVTAAHVTDLGRADSEAAVPIAIATPSGEVVELARSTIFTVDPPFEDDEYTMRSAGARARKPRDEDKIDLAVIKLDDRQRQQLLSEGFRFVGQHDLRLDLPPEEKAWFAVAGFPNERMDNRATRSVYANFAFKHEDELAAPESREWFLLHWDRNDVGEDEEGNRTQLPDPHGMSGGGVWMVSTKPPVNGFDPGSMRLVGVEHSYQDDENWMRCTKIGYVLTILKKFVPGVERALSIALPTPQEVDALSRVVPPWRPK